jgi:hypothetical protein
MNESDFNKLKKIRQLLKEAYDHYFRHSDGHCKSSEGYIGLDFGDYWSDKNCELKITGVQIYSYVLGPSRVHYFDTLDNALHTVIQWHTDQMNTDYNEYGEPESSINDDFYLENPDA